MSRFLTLLLSLLFSWGCSPKEDIIEFHEFKNARWFYKDPCEFNVSISKTSVPKKLKLLLRHNGNYSFQNIQLTYKIYSPLNKLIHSQRLSYNLVSPNMNWLGESACGDLYTLVLLLNKNFLFSNHGNYRIVVGHNMRDDCRDNISEIGFIVSN